jgi:hypothetical protein
MKRKSRKDEQKLRDTLDRQRGSMEGWSKEPQAAKVSKGGGIVFSIRFTSDELKEIRRRAEALGVKMSGLIRRAVLTESVHQPAHVFSVAFIDKPMFATFGEATEGFVLEAGKTAAFAVVGGHQISKFEGGTSMQLNGIAGVAGSTQIGPIPPDQDLFSYRPNESSRLLSQ